MALGMRHSRGSAWGISLINPELKRLLTGKRKRLPAWQAFGGSAYGICASLLSLLSAAIRHYPPLPTHPDYFTLL